VTKKVLQTARDSRRGLLIGALFIPWRQLQYRIPMPII